MISSCKSETNLEWKQTPVEESNEGTLSPIFKRNVASCPEWNVHPISVTAVGTVRRTVYWWNLSRNMTKLWNYIKQSHVYVQVDGTPIQKKLTHLVLTFEERKVELTAERAASTRRQTARTFLRVRPLRSVTSCHRNVVASMSPSRMSRSVTLSTDAYNNADRGRDNTRYRRRRLRHMHRVTATAQRLWRPAREPARRGVIPAPTRDPANHHTSTLTK